MSPATSYFNILNLCTDTLSLVYFRYLNNAAHKPQVVQSIIWLYLFNMILILKEDPLFFKVELLSSFISKVVFKV